MIKCENLSREDIARIGRQVAEAFLGEEGCFAALPAETAEKMFAEIVRACYQAGHLYTTGDRQEGFCVYWTKAERPGMGVQFPMFLRMLGCLNAKAVRVLLDSQNDWTPTEKRYRKADDFVEVFLLAVRKEYQGQGYFRRMLEEPFALAGERGTICVLDTDSRQKADKYAHVGMHVVDSRVQKSGNTMFAMEL